MPASPNEMQHLYDLLRAEHGDHLDGHRMSMMICYTVADIFEAAGREVPSTYKAYIHEINEIMATLRRERKADR